MPEALREFLMTQSEETTMEILEWMTKEPHPIYKMGFLLAQRMRGQTAPENGDLANVPD